MFLFIFVLSVICGFIVYYYTYRNRVCKNLANQDINGFTMPSSNCYKDSNENSDQFHSENENGFKISDYTIDHHVGDRYSNGEYNQNIYHHSNVEHRWNYFQNPSSFRHRRKTKKNQRYHHTDDTTFSNSIRTDFQMKYYNNFDMNSNNHVRNKRMLAFPCYKNFDEDDPKAIIDESSTEDYFGDDEESDEYCIDEYLCDGLDYNQNYFCAESNFSKNFNENKNSAFSS